MNDPKEAESADKRSLRWVARARAEAGEGTPSFKRERRVRELIEKAESFLSGSGEQAEKTAIAMAWCQLLRDWERAERVLGVTADSGAELSVALARALLRAGADRDAREYLEAVTDRQMRGGGAEALTDLAWGWLDLFPEAGRTPAARCLESAERLINDPFVAQACAECYSRLLGADGVEPARRCLAKAERLAEDMPCLLFSCAEAWKESTVFSRKECAEGVVRCLEAAQADTHDASDWCFLAGEWKRLAGNAARALACLERAEALAKNTADWCSVGSAYGSFHGTVTNHDLRRSFEMAMETAATCADWIRCARQWHESDMEHEHWGDRIASCLQRAESTATTALEWAACATAWAEVLLDPDRHELARCVDRMQAMDVSAREWARCASLMVDTSFRVDRDGTLACLSQAQRRAQTFEDWLACAEVYALLVPYGTSDQAAVQCLNRCVALAETATHRKDMLAVWCQLSPERYGAQIKDCLIKLDVLRLEGLGGLTRVPYGAEHDPEAPAALEPS